MSRNCPVSDASLKVFFFFFNKIIIIKIIIVCFCSSSTTHVVSENNTGDEVDIWIKKQEMEGKVSANSVNLLDISWLTESMASGNPVPIQDWHRLKVMILSTCTGIF